LLGGGPGWYALASAVAASRVYIRLHHASDVAAGAAVGLALGIAFRRFVR
jgi:undecaprenyl-diphosphatase